MSSQQGSVGAAFSPDVVSLCCAKVERQEHLMLCHWAGDTILIKQTNKQTNKQKQTDAWCVKLEAKVWRINSNTL